MATSRTPSKITETPTEEQATTTPSPTRTTLEIIRQKILDGQTVTVPEYAAARSSVEFAEMVGDLSGQRRAAAEAAELERQRAEFTASVLDDPLLAQGAAAAAAHRLRDSVSEALTVYLDSTGQINEASHAAVRGAKELGLVDDVTRPVHYRGGTGAGLVVNGNRIEITAAWHTKAERACTSALAQARREHP